MSDIPKTRPRPKNKLLALVLIVIAVLYGVLPVDLIPDMLLPFGLADDAVIIIGAISYFYKAFFGGEKGKKEEKGEG